MIPAMPHCGMPMFGGNNDDGMEYHYNNEAPARTMFLKSLECK
jgi:hypothetical protein